MIVVAGAIQRQADLTIHRLNLSIKTRAATCVASGTSTSNADFQPERILIAIGTQLDHALQVARGFALFQSVLRERDQ